MDVAEWGRQFFGSSKAVKSGNFHRHTAGWHEEKLTYQQELQSEILEEIREKRLKEYIRLQDKLFSLVEMKMQPSISVKDLQLIWQIISSAQAICVNESSHNNTDNAFSTTVLDAMLMLRKIDKQKSLEKDALQSSTTIHQSTSEVRNN